jgi:DNA-binding NarL/FixJ family response regulator
MTASDHLRPQASRVLRIPATCNVVPLFGCDAGVAMALRCLIVDDNASFLAAARALLEMEGITVVDVATTASEGLRRGTELRPDVILVDIHLGSESGFALARQLVDGAAHNVILISTHPQEDFVELVAESPVLGFIPKTELSKEAIERLLDEQQPARRNCR